MTKREAELIERFVENSLDENETRELHTLIQTRPEMIDEIADAMIMTGLARWSRNGRERSERLQQALRATLARGTLPGATEQRVMTAVRSARARRHFIRRFIPLAAAASLLAALGIGLWLNQAGPASRGIVARVESVQGSVFSVQDIAPKRQALKAGDEIREGTRIETGEDGAVKLAWLAEATTVEVAENSKLETRNSKLALLRQGRLAAVVAPQPPGNPFAVETPHALATALGTRFRLEVRGETGHPTLDARRPAPDPSPLHSTWLSVEEGTVRFLRLADQESLDVAADRFAVVGENDAAFALKTYPADAEWVDGPVIFRDDFEQELDRWETTLWKNLSDGRIVQGTDSSSEAGRHVRIRPDAGRAPGNNAMELHHAFGKDKTLVARPRADITASAFVVEFDFRPLASFGVNCFSAQVSAQAKAPMQDMPVDAREKEQANAVLQRSIREGRWYVWRQEYLVRSDSANLLSVEGRSFYDEFLHARFVANLIEEFRINFSVRKGHILIDNYVIRELIPVETP